MNTRQHHQSGTRWEEEVGFSRAVRAGNLIEVAGTTAVKDGQIIGLGDAYQQAEFIIQKIQIALHQLGGDLKDVIRTRIYVTDVSLWKDVGKAHQQFF